ncbi:non-ribosomal peptide synthetase [Methanobrevibacter sp. YE315]|uniref:non-ribosomal peptide synthetase n=1 Tax=Methanobrevibacter sp. YE315 TaxID=1609968 RepID=UPI000B0A1BA8|nr:non-ribosomal peptide synthetase [Methanobrevibacter sp. YE315]
MDVIVQKYYYDLISSFDFATTISPDVKDKETKYEIKSTYYNEKIKELKKEFDSSERDLFLSVFLFNLVKFSFSKDILIAYNKQAAGYHFDTDLTVEEYIYDFKSQFKDFHDYDYLDFESEILFSTQDYNKEDYKFIFSYDEKEITVEYDSAYYSDELIDAFLSAFNVLIEKFSSNHHESLKNISIVENIDLDEGFEVKLANEGLINKIFENAVSEDPDKVILYTEDGEFTYDELNKKANRIANALLKRGLEVEDRVMLMMRRNSELIASVLGTVKAGGAFIPIDPNYPKHRIDQMLEDSESKFVITNKDVTYEGENGVHVSKLLEEEDDTNPDVELTPDNLCFLIYTSGSTGKPKGVMITHRGISNYIANHPENVPIYELNRRCTKFVSISMISFIVFLREIFGTILNGLPVVFTNDEQLVNPLEFYKLFKQHNADAFGGTPTRLIEYLSIKEIQELVKECKIIVVGGEGFPPILYDRLREFTDADIYNSYGPTEVTIASHYKLIDSNEITAGWKMLNVVDKIMDIDGNQLPPYVPGDVYVGGAGIARGYINNPEQTEKVFMTLNGIPYYNTGDYCKKDKDGELYVLGRNDGQIKLRGLRIEPSEIETLIAKFDNVLISKVLIKKVNETDYLCAYFTATEKINIEDLKQHLLDNLPAYMLPSFFTQLDAFPKTPNGKTDFKNLPDPQLDMEEFIDPRNDIEQGIFDIVSELLGTDDFGINTDLFKVGLTSLSVVQLVSAVYEQFNTQLMVTDVMKYKTIENIAKHINFVEEESQDLQDLYPLTQNQLGVYFDCLKNPEKLSYNIPKKIEFNSEIDADKLKQAICKAIDNHPYLKAKIVMYEGGVYQQRREIEVDDLIEIVDGEVDIKDFIKPFNLEEDLLFRFKIVNSSVLLADFHHIIVDGTSLNILFDEIAKIYDGKEYELEEVDGFDYSLNEAKIESSSMYKESELFFFNKIKEFDEATLMTPDLSGDEHEGVGLEKILSLDKNRIDDFCNKVSITQNNLFLAATSFVLSKFAYDKNLLIATITNGRFNPNQQKTLAMMVKTLPLALNLNSDLTIAEFFEYINKEWFDVLSHSSYPLTKISDGYGIVPEFVYAFHGNIVEDIEIAGQTVKRQSLDEDNLKFKLNLNVVENGGEYDVSMKYNDQLYSSSLIQTFLDSFSVIINKFTTFSQDTPLKDISIVDSKDLSIDDLDFQELEEYRLNKIFEKQVELHPDEIAIYAEDGDYTFSEINTRANKIANALIKRGVGAEDKVMFILKRDSNVFASIFGILKSGAAFIPVDSDYPKDRVEHVLTDSDAKFIIIDDIVDIKNIDLSEYSDNLIQISELLEETDDSNPDPELKGDNLAYIIYTSGSTGLPKGVMIEHRNLANFVYPDPRSVYTYELATNGKKEGYIALSISTVAFDMLHQETMTALMNGIPIAFANDVEYKDSLALCELIKRTGANVYSGTPSRLLHYFELEDLGKEFSKFKILSIGGEGFPPQLLDILDNLDAKVYNMYGPTETTVVCNAHLIDDGKLNIGKPYFNVFESIMDLDGNPLPPNVMGELYIAGGGVSRGYLNRPENNAKAYVEINGIRFYRSGDYAKVDEDGNISIHGRLDNQIKLRGLRIEIGEIESVISEFEPINSVAVVVKKIKNNDHLCAYFTVNEKYKAKYRDSNEFSFDIEELKAVLSEKLTYYMVPTVYMELDEMPQTLNGKTDLKNLPEPELISEYVAPKNEVEGFFANVFAEILDLDEVSVTDNFFEIGGTSLLVTKITMEALNRGYELTYGDVFKNPTPRLLSELISSNHFTESSEEIKYDYSGIDNLLKKNNLTSFINGELEDDLGDVLLTGATGFLGIHVLRELLESETGKIYCLLRSKAHLSATDRLKSLVFYYFEDSVDENIFDERVEVIEGDITDFKYFENIVSLNIDTVVNCAANVKHFSSGTDIEDINLGGVINGLKFAKMKNAKYVQVSTYSVAGESINNFPPLDVAFTENDLFIGQGIDNQYISSKFLAERAVLEAAVEDDLDVKIMRVGNLMARSSDSEFQINFESNGFINRLKAFITMGKMPYEMLSNNVEFSQIDRTAKSIIALAKTPKDCVVFHPYNSHNITFADIIEIIRPLGLIIDPCEDEEYENALKEALADKSKQDGVSGLITSVGSGKVKKQWLAVDNNYTTQVLYRLGINWPLISEKYIYTFVKYLDDLDFFNVGD